MTISAPPTQNRVLVKQNEHFSLSSVPKDFQHNGFPTFALAPLPFFHQGKFEFLSQMTSLSALITSALNCCYQCSTFLEFFGVPSVFSNRVRKLVISLRHALSQLPRHMYVPQHQLGYRSPVQKRKLGPLDHSITIFSYYSIHLLKNDKHLVQMANYRAWVPLCKIRSPRRSSNLKIYHLSFLFFSLGGYC